MIGVVLVALAVYFYFIPAKRYIAIVLVFALSTSGFQLVPNSLMLIPGVTKVYDWVYVFGAIIFFFKPQLLFDRFVLLQFKHVFLFLIVLGLLFVRSVYYANIELSIAIRVVRLLFYFIFLLLFVPLELDDYKKVFRILIYLTGIGAIIYCVQPILNKAILNKIVEFEFYFLQDSNVKRFYNFPVFILPLIFFFFLSREEFKIKHRGLFGTVILICILLTQFRNYMIALFVCFLLNLYLKGKLKAQVVLVYTIVGLFFFSIADNALNHRISRGFGDLTNGSFSTSKSALYAITSNNMHLLSTSEFRWYHLMERVHYVVDNHKLWFGIGLANEDSWVAKTLHFVVGTSNETDNSVVPQIDTGDVTWSLLILQMGLIGIIFFINAYFSLFRIFYRHKEDAVMTVGLLYIVALFISSLYMIDIIAPYYICLLALFAAYAYNLNRAKTDAPEVVAE